MRLSPKRAVTMREQDSISLLTTRDFRYFRQTCECMNIHGTRTLHSAGRACRAAPSCCGLMNLTATPKTVGVGARLEALRVDGCGLISRGCWHIEAVVEDQSHLLCEDSQHWREICRMY